MINIIWEYVMKRLMIMLLCAALTISLCACRKASTAKDAPPAAVSGTLSPTPTAPPAAQSPEPTAPPAAMTPEPRPETPEAEEGWAESYFTFLDDNFDILSALWPGGLTGVGFIDLDLDGTPEMLLFDQGASATLGVQLFDVSDGRVYCVSSVQESASGAFGGEHFSRVSVCASFFESFRLSQTEDGFCFWVLSANGTLESSWDELVRFDAGEDGIMVPVSVCAHWLESDEETGTVVSERYSVGGRDADKSAYDEAHARYAEAPDTGYEAKGVFLWNDMQSYDTTFDGLMAMARDAAECCVPVSSIG